MKLTFDDVCHYAEWLGFKHRGEPSKSYDWTQTYFWNGWRNCHMMVLYEGEKRIVKGHTQPEVCWVCIDPNGKVLSVPSRHLRKMEQVKGFGFTDTGRGCLAEYFDTINTKKPSLLDRLLGENGG